MSSETTTYKRKCGKKTENTGGKGSGMHPCQGLSRAVKGCQGLSRAITERPHAPGGVAAFMSAHSKTQYVTPSMDISSGKGVVRGRRAPQLEFGLPVCVAALPRAIGMVECGGRYGGGGGLAFAAVFAHRRQ